MAKLEELYNTTENSTQEQAKKAQQAIEPPAMKGKPVAEKIKEQMAVENFTHDFLRSPEDALVIWGLSEDKINFAKWLNKQFMEIVNIVAKKTGAAKQIADKDKRTPEQEELLLKAGAAKQIARMNAYFKSKFYDAMQTLEEVHSEYKDPEDIPEKNFFPMPLKEQATLYFFALHKDIDQKSLEPLTDGQKEELKNIFSRLDAFAVEYAKSKEIKEQGYKIIEAFIDREYPKKKEAETIAEEIRIKAKSIKKPLIPLDVLQNNIFRKSFIGDKVEAGKANIACAINFKELEGVTITDKLSPFDKEVHRAIYDLYKAGNEYFSIAQLHRAMGNDTRPAAYQIKKLNESLTKMGMARIFIDNDDETKIYKKYKRYRYDGPLLPFERVQGGAYINGVFTEAVIHLFREPPLFTFARQRKQVLNIPRVLLSVFSSQTETNLQIRDYLLVKINAIKKKAIPSKITWETLFKGCDITTKKQRHDGKEKVTACLEYFKKHDYIKGYTINDEGISITY